MFGPAVAYVVAIFAMLFAALSALTLITTIDHLDTPAVEDVRETFPEKVAV